MLIEMEQALQINAGEELENEVKDNKPEAVTSSGSAEESDPTGIPGQGT